MRVGQAREDALSSRSQAVMRQILRRFDVRLPVFFEEPNIVPAAALPENVLEERFRALEPQVGPVRERPPVQLPYDRPIKKIASARGIYESSVQVKENIFYLVSFHFFISIARPFLKSVLG